jgi:hypothetical protein
MASTKHSGPSITTGDSGGRSHAGQPVLHQHGVEVQRFGQMRLFPIALSYQAKTAPVSSIEDGVDATMRLAVSSELDGATGRYFEGMTESRASDQAYDAGARQRLWRLSETLVGMEHDEVTTADGGKER